MRCDYPGCQEPASISCHMLGCMHQVCETHGNCVYEETPDHSVPICWYCCGKGWGEMPSSPIIVCLCGSTRFSEAFHEANLTETLAGRIVLSIGCDFKSDRDLLLAGELTAEDKVRLDELHLRKIDLASEILVLNVNGYIGQSTRREIEYAEAHGKQVRYLEHKMSL